jgi:hypothetical protein
MKLGIFCLIEAHFGVRSDATNSKIAEKQVKNWNFWPDRLPPQQVFFKDKCMFLANITYFCSKSILL